MILYDYPKNYIREKDLKMISDLKSGNVPFKPRIDYNYYYRNLIKTGFKNLLKYYSNDIANLI